MNAKIAGCVWILGSSIALAAADDASVSTEIDTAAAHPEDGSDAVRLELYSSPYGKHASTPIYPRSAISQNKEGWVRLDFMVDPNGDPYEIAVTEWVGDTVFHDVAVRALEDDKFEPARFDGQPLDAGHFRYYHFELDDDTGARAKFVRSYRALMAAIGEGSRDDADRLLAQLESSGALNLYEDAFLHVAKSGYYATWGDEHQQLRALNRAVGHHTAEKRLPESTYLSLQRARFLLLVQTGDFGRAVETFETLSEFPLDESDLAPLRAVMEKLDALRTDDRPYTVPGDFGDRFSWSYSLFKDEFFLADVQGEIEEIKLRCARKYVFLRFDPDVQYKIKKDYQPCHLQLIGDPGTTFTLTQL